MNAAATTYNCSHPLFSPFFQLPRASISRLMTVLLLLRSLSPPPPSSLHDACHACIPPFPPYARKLPHSLKLSFSSPDSTPVPTSPGPSSPSSTSGVLNAGSSFYTHLPPKHMSQYENLCAQVFSDSRPTSALYNERLDFIQEICSSLSSALPHAETALLVMCGSCASLLSHAGSDLDVTLLFDSARGTAANDEKLLKHFCKALNKSHPRRAPKPMRAHFIHSRVPIVHVTKGPHECDIGLNKTDNIVKAFLFELYVRLDPRVAPLIHIIKAWARQPHVDLNDASRGTFNSFSITLMIIGYLQSIEPPVLPCIQAAHVPMPDGSSYSPNWAWSAEMNVNPALRAPMARHIVGGLQNFGSRNVMSVAELLLGFFRYYSCVFDPSIWAVCVANGKPRMKSHIPCVQGQRRDIVVQDPIVIQENTCRGINADVLERLRVPNPSIPFFYN